MKSLLRLWEKFENLINSGFEQLFAFCQIRVKKIVTKTKAFKERNDNQPKRSLTEHAKNIISIVTPKIKNTAAKASAQIGIAVKRVQQIDRKKLAPKVIGGALVSYILEYGTKLKYWYLTVRPEVFLGYTLATGIVTISSINIYKATQTISKEQARSPAQAAILESGSDSSQEQGPPPAPSPYSLVQRRQLSLYEVVVPVLIETDTGIKSLLIDMDIQTSNRYSREILHKKEYLVKDRLNRTLRPVIPEFPLTDEGKRILKQKIKNELDALLKEMGVNGKIEIISFIYIMAA